MDKWILFYTPFFENPDSVYAFVERLENLGPEDSMHPAKIMMHQTQRLVSLADDIQQIRPNRESLQLLFFLICAEHIAKMHSNFEHDGQSRQFTRKFFNEFVLPRDQRHLVDNFRRTRERSPLDLQEIVDLLYDVRCDVVHEGKYWGFSFHDGHTSMVNYDPSIIVSMMLSEFRSIVVRGCINAINTYQGCPNQQIQMDPAQAPGR